MEISKRFYQFTALRDTKINLCSSTRKYRVFKGDRLIGQGEWTKDGQHVIFLYEGLSVNNKPIPYAYYSLNEKDWKVKRFKPYSKDI